MCFVEKLTSFSYILEWKLSDIPWFNHICWPYHGIVLFSHNLLANFGTKTHFCIRLVETSLLYVLWTSWLHTVTFQIENWVTYIELVIFVRGFMVLFISATIRLITLERRHIFVSDLLKRAYYLYCGQVDILIQFHFRLKIKYHSMNLP